MQKPHKERNGTYILLRNDGTAIRITVDGGEVVDELEIME